MMTSSSARDGRTNSELSAMVVEYTHSPLDLTSAAISKHVVMISVMHGTLPPNMAPDVLHASGGIVNVSWQVALKTLPSLTLISAPVTLKLKSPNYGL